MKVEEVKAKISQLELYIDDPEAAHSLEVDLYTDVLHAIAIGANNAKNLALEALKAKDIDFPRWFA